MTNIGKRQHTILEAFRNKDCFTKAEAVDLIGIYYYCNAHKYVGDVLARMVKRRLIERIKRGVYRVGRGSNPPASPPERSDGKCKWCKDSGCLVCGKEIPKLKDA